MSMGLMTKATGAMDKIGAFVKSLAKNAVPIAIVSAAVPDIMDFLGGLTEPFAEVGEAMEELGLTASDGFTQMADDITNSIYDLQPVAESIGVWVGDMYEDVKAKDWDSLSENVTEGLGSAWESIVGFFEGDTLEDVAKGGAAVINGIADFLANTTQEEWGIIYDSITGALTTFFETVDWEGVFVGITTALYNLGTILVSRFWEGVDEWWQEVSGSENTFTFDFGSGYGGFG